jgi:hypothetical protein
LWVSTHCNAAEHLWIFPENNGKCLSPASQFDTFLTAAAKNTGAKEVPANAGTQLHGWIAFVYFSLATQRKVH